MARARVRRGLVAGAAARIRAGGRRVLAATSTTGARARLASTASRNSRRRSTALGIHFIHVRSPHADALPLVMTHGWPGSIVEFQKVIEPLTNPTAHGGDAADAFHLVCPSLPGYGFSDKPTRNGWNVQRIARAWSELMPRLGYKRYAAQGGDWGSIVTTCIGIQDPANCVGIHLNMPIAMPDPATMNDLTERRSRRSRACSTTMIGTRAIRRSRARGRKR